MTKKQIEKIKSFIVETYKDIYKNVSKHPISTVVMVWSIDFALFLPLSIYLLYLYTIYDFSVYPTFLPLVSALYNRALIKGVIFYLAFRRWNYG